jgi:PTH1 family peptidyl-tRNA hydrolase
LSSKRLIVGLGNPGKEYEYARHNLGFLVVSRMAEENGWRLRSSSITQGLVAEGRMPACEVVLLLPLSFMNNSGIVVKSLLASKDIDTDHLLIVYDDFSLNFGQMRLKASGSGGGHNGLASVIEHLGTKEFARLRMGIGPSPPSQNHVDFVLGSFNSAEKKELPAFVRQGVACCRDWLTQDFGTVMSRYNARISAGEEKKSQ